MRAVGVSDGAFSGIPSRSFSNNPCASSLGDRSTLNILRLGAGSAREKSSSPSESSSMRKPPMAFGFREFDSTGNERFITAGGELDGYAAGEEAAGILRDGGEDRKVIELVEPDFERNGVSVQAV